jgi:putative salt-induced outer membrane protein YdiY
MTFSRTLLCLALSAPAAALAFQSIETDTINPADQGASGNVLASLDGRSGNTDLVDYTAGGRLNYRARETDMFVLIDHSRAKVHDQQVENSTWGHAEFRDEFQRGLAVEFFLDGKQDDFQQLDSRVQLGANARFTLNYTPDVRAVYAGIGILHEWEDQVGHSDNYWRLNSYFTYKRQINAQVRGLFNVSFQPRLDRSRDYLIGTEAAVLVKLAEQLDLKVGVKYAYDHAAPIGIKSGDTQYSTSLNFHF